MDLKDLFRRCFCTSEILQVDAAPGLEGFFEDGGEREAARNFIDLKAAAERE